MSASKKSCPVVRWTIRREDAGGVKRYVFHGRIPGRPPIVEGELWPVIERNIAYVGWSYSSPSYRRCGLGTQLYEQMLAKACALGLRLASDTTRTKYSDGFWKKQTAKGRASCIEQGQRVYDPDRGGWNCERYAMRAACPQSMSLAGLRKRKTGKKRR